MSDCDRLAERVPELLADEAFPGRTELERHAGSCAECRATLAAYRDIESAYRALPESEVPPALSARVLAEARESAAARTRTRTRRRLVLVAAVLLLVLGPLAWDYFADRASARELLRSGDALHVAGQLEPAKNAYEQALAADRGDELAAQILLRLVRVELALGEPERALMRLIELDVRDVSGSLAARSLRLRFEALLAAGQEDEAHETYQILARDFPDAARELDELRTTGALARDPTELSLEDLEALSGLGYGGGD